ncbi:MAG: ABC transporter permease [Oscillospiraceae bacterium]|nr:ABC transporter permease [Oscillospiraceae bacterium]
MTKQRLFSLLVMITTFGITLLFVHPVLSKQYAWLATMHPVAYIAVRLLYLFVCFLIGFIVSNFKTYLSFGRDIFTNRKMLLNLSYNDFKKKYVSSYFGSVWGFVIPLVQILTFWFVFQVGFKSGEVSGHPYILWLIAGIIPWFFISESILAGTMVFLEYGFLVKKIVFKVELLPIVKVISAFFNHVFFLLVLFVAFMIGGFPITIYSLQVIYYLVCLFVLLFALSLLFSTLHVFVRDVGQIVSIVIQIGFWFTPIGWVFKNTIQGPVSVLFEMNPFFYIVEGYRDAFVYKVWFWEHPILTAYFWIFVAVVFLVAIKSFNRLHSHFADLI